MVEPIGTTGNSNVLMYPASRKQTKSHGGSKSLTSDAKSRFGKAETRAVGVASSRPPTV
jgi:hypothetical protein